MFNLLIVMPMKNLVKSMLLAALLVVGVSCEKQFEEAGAVAEEMKIRIIRIKDIFLMMHSLLLLPRTMEIKSMLLLKIRR